MRQITSFILRSLLLQLGEKALAHHPVRLCQLAGERFDFLAFPGHVHTGGHVAITAMHPRQGRGHLEVFLLRNGIKLVIVTTGAVHRQPEETLGHRSHDVGHFILPHDLALLVPVGLEPVEGPADEKPGGGDGTGMTRFEDIPRDLPLHELVVGHVRVQGIYHPVPVGPCVRSQLIVFKAIALAIAGHVEPVAGPAFPIMWRGQQDINLSTGAGRRGKAGQAIVQPATDHPLTRFRSRLQSHFLKLGKDEGIDGVSHPVRFLHGRHLRSRHRL